jgi:hypothetical protein
MTVKLSVCMCVCVCVCVCVYGGGRCEWEGGCSRVIVITKVSFPKHCASAEVQDIFQTLTLLLLRRAREKCYKNFGIIQQDKFFMKYF